MEYFCNYCNVVIPSRDQQLEEHCVTEEHRIRAVSDEERKWKYRCFPAGFWPDTETVCQWIQRTGRCTNRWCNKAHDQAELQEWKERWSYRYEKVQKSTDIYLEDYVLGENFPMDTMFMPGPAKRKLVKNLENVCVTVSPDLALIVHDRTHIRKWTFNVFSKVRLREIHLLNGVDRLHFSALGTTVKRTGYFQEDRDPCNSHGDQGYMYTCKIQFVRPSCGNFEQFVAFDFGGKSLILRKLVIEVLPEDRFEKLFGVREETATFAKLFISKMVQQIPFKNPVSSAIDSDGELLLYPMRNSNNFVSQAVVEPSLTVRNYRSRQHQLLFLEEMEQQKLLSRYSCVAQLHVTSFLPASDVASNRNIVVGSLFGHFRILPWIIKEGIKEGNVMIYNCDTLLLAPVKGRERVYEAVVVCKEKHEVWIQLSRTCVEDLELKPNTKFEAQLQFQVKRLPFCEMHLAVDKLQSISLIFPDVGIIPRFTLETKWTNLFMNRCLNSQQKKAILTITAPTSFKLPPVLIAGPFGTGKTLVLFEAVKLLLLDPANRILLCTHSDSAADIYITEYFHPYVEGGNKDATPYRHVHSSYKVDAAHPTVQKYCPKTEQELFFEMHRIVVSNIRTCSSLPHIGIQKGAFTHILIDGAAQSLECENIIPISLAAENTRIVLAGDWMKVAPKVYSTFAKESGFGKSLLERLWNLYPEEFPFKFLLTENYSSHKAIVNFFASTEFYGHHVSVRTNTPVSEYYPLTYLPVKAQDDEDDRNCISTGYSSSAEVSVIVKWILQFKQKWPKNWGAQDDNSIGVLTPYLSQVSLIEARLRENNINNVFVGRVSDAEGRRFRVLFLSIARCCRTYSRVSDLSALKYANYGPDLGFLSDEKLTYAALSKAQSLVAVVGHLVPMCASNDSRNWCKKFISICREKKSIHETDLHQSISNSEIPSSTSAPEISTRNVSSRKASNPYFHKRKGVAENSLNRKFPPKSVSTRGFPNSELEERNSESLPEFWPSDPESLPENASLPLITVTEISASGISAVNHSTDCTAFSAIERQLYVELRSNYVIVFVILQFFEFSKTFTGLIIVVIFVWRRFFRSVDF